MAAISLSKADRDLVLRAIMDAQHILAVQNGATMVEPGVDPEDADEVTSWKVDNRDLLWALEVAQRALGWSNGDPVPPPLSEQLAQAMRRA